MYLKKISITNFKNISQAQIIFSPKINCITGINGSGKTNLLDAVYYLSMTKSFFPGLDQYTIKYDCDMTALHAEYSREDGTEEKISLSLDINGEKRIKRNSKSYTRLSDHVGLIPVVMVSPADACLINESGEERRKFLNAILSQLDREYLRKLQNYNQLLNQRNRLLKGINISDELLSTFSEQLSTNASYIYKSRKEFCNKLLPLVSYYYSMLSGGRESIDIEYRSDLEEARLIDLLEQNRERDKAFKFTTTGIQRDDLLFLMNGFPIRRCGSQGQQKSFLISLKLAQFSIMKEIHKVPPVLLLDDVFDKLDMLRVEYLLRLVASDFFGQIFITDSSKVRISNILETINGDSVSIEIENGWII
ncbi:MAG: DNA replication and repair protein RecF [Rikenellaceae bacterium]